MRLKGTVLLRRRDMHIFNLVIAKVIVSGCTARSHNGIEAIKNLPISYKARSMLAVIDNPFKPLLFFLKSREDYPGRRAS
jgi:hypothetical protein